MDMEAAMFTQLDQNPISVVSMGVARLRPYTGNARTHSKKQIRQIADSIRKFGFTNPILVSDDDEIIAGHGRVEAAKLLGMQSVPTLRLSHLDAAQRRAYVIADNKLALNEERQDVAALQLTPHHHTALRVNAVDLKNRLRNIETDCRDRLHD